MNGGWEVLLVAAGLVLVLYAGLVVWLLARGRRSEARALAGFVADCFVLFRRLLADPRDSMRRKLMLGAVVGYLAMPFDLVPDIIPVAGQADDAILVARALRAVLRGGGQALLREHWPGPQSSLRVVVRLAYGSRASR